MIDPFKWPEFLDDFAESAAMQGFGSEVILETEDGAMVAWERASRGDGPQIYLSAGIHGDEPAGPLAALELMKSGAFSEDVHWLICPALNPGGLALGTRENRQECDLNRDYFLRESLEVAAHARWLTRDRVPDVFISLHEDWESKGFYFYEINLREDEPERAASVLSAVSPHFEPEPGPEIDGHEVREPGWIFHCAEADLPDEWPEAIFLAKRGCPLSFTLETPSQQALDSRVNAHIAAFKQLLNDLS